MTNIYLHIKSIGVILSDDERLANSLSSAHICFARQKNSGRYYVFNIRKETLDYYARKHNPTSCRFYENGEPDSSFDIPAEICARVERQLSENIQRFDNPDDIIDITMNQVGQYPWYVRRKLYRCLSPLVLETE